MKVPLKKTKLHRRSTRGSGSPHKALQNPHSHTPRYKPIYTRKGTKLSNVSSQTKPWPVIHPSTRPTGEERTYTCMATNQTNLIGSRGIGKTGHRRPPHRCVCGRSPVATSCKRTHRLGEYIAPSDRVGSSLNQPAPQAIHRTASHLSFVQRLAE